MILFFYSNVFDTKSIFLIINIIVINILFNLENLTHLKLNLKSSTIKVLQISLLYEIIVIFRISAGLVDFFRLMSSYDSR